MVSEESRERLGMTLNLKRFVARHSWRWSCGRCFRSVDSSSDSSPKFIAIDEETHNQIMHRGRFGKTDRATHEPLDPRTQIDVLAFDLLRMGFAHRVLRGIEMTLVGAPSISIESGDVKRGQELLPLEKHVILPSPKDICQHGPTVMINGMPEPPRLGFLADLTPHLIEFGGQPSAVVKLLGAIYRHLHLLWWQALQHCVIHLLDRRCLFLSSVMTVVGLTCNTRAVSRMPLVFRAISTICCFTSGDCAA